MRSDAKFYPDAIVYRHVVDPHWFAITATNSGTYTLQWCAETFCPSTMEHPAGQPAYKQVEALAADSVPGARGLLFDPLLQGERSPYWDPHLRGDFVGIHRQHRLEDFARAMLERLAFSLRDCFELVNTFGGSINELYLIGGGAESQLWSQIICNAIGRKLTKPVVQTAAYGSAILAGIATGMFRGWTDALKMRTLPSEDLRPVDTSRQLYEDDFATYLAVTRALQPLAQPPRQQSARGEQ